MIILELLVFVPALEKILDFYYMQHSKTIRNVFMLVILMLPPIVYIDHGHF